MIRKKVAMVGAFAVGKTSLVKRFVSGIFTGRYQTTIGVRIDKKSIVSDGRDVELMLWDLSGEDEFQGIRHSYLRGSSGFFLVIDGTRAGTLDVAVRLRNEALAVTGDVPHILLVNKCDLRSEWDLAQQRLDALRAAGWEVIETSAKDGERVEDAFSELTRRMLES